ncbi:Hsp20/alpha crystallin family protein [Desulfococcaceae bacterium HSG7]|nr:Hsp20/alpha crystallin family protein [Desulfococcaceae bacterium HSG7]
MLYRTSFSPPAWRYKNPFEEFENVRQKMENLFGTLSNRSYKSMGAGVFPAVNLTEDQGCYYVRAEIPGVKNDDLELNITDSTLTIGGERKIPKESEEARYHRRERKAGKFSRAIALPGEINSEKVEAALVNGVLTVTVPKAEKVKPRQITVR